MHVCVIIAITTITKNPKACIHTSSGLLKRLKIDVLWTACRVHSIKMCSIYREKKDESVCVYGVKWWTLVYPTIYVRCACVCLRVILLMEFFFSLQKSKFIYFPERFSFSFFHNFIRIRNRIHIKVDTQINGYRPKMVWFLSFVFIFIP